MKRGRLALAALLFCFFFALAPAQSQNLAPRQSQPIVVHPIQVPPQARDIQLARLQAIAEQMASAPPDLTLVPRGEGARHGQIWIRTEQIPSYSYGLWIAGKVDGPPPDFAPTLDLLPSKDHIEIWLAASRDVDLPEIGWNDHGGLGSLPQGAASCKDWAEHIHEEVETMGGSKNNPYLARLGGAEGIKECQAWAASQARYREYFKRLFVRQWLVGPQQIEVFATPASEHISDWYFESQYSYRSPQFMRPQSSLEVHLFPETATYPGEMTSQQLAKIFPNATGYTFAVFIPFQSFPPLPSLETNELYVLVDVFNAAPPGKKMGAYSSSSPARVWGKPSTFNALRLDPPFSFPLTPCHYPLQESSDQGDKDFVWVLPNLRSGPDALSDTFEVVTQNKYVWGGDEPSGLSPQVMTYHHFSRYLQFGPGKDKSVWLCGPYLAFAQGGQTKSHPDKVISEEGFDYKQMPDGHLLIKIGPEVGAVGWGPGAGQADTKINLRIFDLSQDLEIDTALALEGILSPSLNLLSQDFTISPDWSQVTEYDMRGSEEEPVWSSTTWCLNSNSGRGYSYEKCGEKQNVQPPNPPVLKQLRQ